MQRRQFLSGMGRTMLGSVALAGAVPAWSGWTPSRREVPLLNTARNVIFIFLEGGPCHIDTFDLKTGPHNPESFDGRTYGDMFWPTGVMPNLAQRTHLFSLVRSLSGVELVHSRAVYHLLTAHRFNAGLIHEIPHFSAVISHMLAQQREERHTLPTVITVDNRTAGNGFLAVDHLGLDLRADAVVPARQHPVSDEEARFQLLNTLLDQHKAVDKRRDAVKFHHQARKLMTDHELTAILDELEGQSVDDVSLEAFLYQCRFAHRMIAADKGVRVIQMKLNGWDHHRNIYVDDGDYSLAGRCRFLDAGVAQLLDDLRQSPAQHTPGKTLLDETLVVAMGEFGRTVGELNGMRGRDHYPYVTPALIAGGGVVGGRVVGATTADGAAITDPGWSHNRYMSILDLMATVYSALGVDYTATLTGAPSGRDFELVDTTTFGPAHTIDALFA